MVSMMIKVKSIKAEFVDPKAPDLCSFLGGANCWGSSAKALRMGIPTIVSLNLSSTPDDEAWTARMCRNPEQTKT